MKPKMLSNEEQDVAMLVIPKILSPRQRCMAHPETGAWRLVHLAEEHHHVRQHTPASEFLQELHRFPTSLVSLYTSRLRRSFCRECPPVLSAENNIFISRKFLPQ
jgi:hypothetical protein